MDIHKTYEDANGIRYKFIGFQNNKYQMKVIDSPFAEIEEGIVEEMDELPSFTVDEETEPVYKNSQI